MRDGSIDMVEDVLPGESATARAAQTHELGIELLERSMIIFETAGVAILVAMIAATATAIKGRGERE